MKKMIIAFVILGLTLSSCGLFNVDFNNIRIITEQQKISILGVNIISEVSVHKNMMAFGGYKSTYPDPDRGEYVYLFEKSLGNWEFKENFYVNTQGYNNFNLSYYDSLLLIANSESTQLYRSHNGNWRADTVFNSQISAVAVYKNDVVIAHPGFIDFYHHNGDSWQKTSFESSPSYHQKVQLKENFAIIGDYTMGYYRGGIKFFNKNDDWEMQESLLYWDAKVNDNFAYDFDVSEKYIIAGAPSIYYPDYDNIGNSRVYIFKRDNDFWTLDDKISIADTNKFNYYGSSVAISNSYAVIGAPGDNEFGESAGAAYLYKKTITGWMLKSKLVASDAQTGDSFGYRVEMTENNDILISSYGAQSIYYFRP